MLKFDSLINQLVDSCHDEMKETIEYNIKTFYKKYENVMEELIKYVYIDNLDDLELNTKIVYTFKPVGCACYALRKSETKSFNLLFEIIQKGGDADTNCAVTGAVLGAHLVFSKLPKYLVNNLYYRKYLENKINRFLITL